jgi:hypothetical protein
MDGRKKRMRKTKREDNGTLKGELEEEEEEEEEETMKQKITYLILVSSYFCCVGNISSCLSMKRNIFEPRSVEPFMIKSA